MITGFDRTLYDLWHDRSFHLNSDVRSNRHVVLLLQQHKQCLTAEYSVMIHWMLTNYMDNCGNSRANTCRKASSSWWSAFIRPRPKVATPYGGDSG
ncbi:hypothetical protein DERF_004691 [Dermatophagoides farinae]|uniref:Uncharacterized protein n=1 Tax=Dermatophagoides farinae TaxID=6954 RepID=A0A922I494_DERFA|nr:hypothetical protein DERF_004691 [Dermatophagoides farinae]